ncbi:MAG: hypothetical protein QNJ38_23710 [Prochloraceae cyanobacterium]|nr:hypothetical protein [Prochloraceae cyanobacterium]
MSRARLYDDWDFMMQAAYNPDGTMKEAYKEELKADPMFNDKEIIALEARRVAEVKAFDEQEKMFEEKYGVGYTEYCQQAKTRQKYLSTKQDRIKKLHQDIANGEELSSLGEWVDPSDYYDGFSGELDL